MLILSVVTPNTKHSHYINQNTLYETLQKNNNYFQKVSYQRSNRYNRCFDHNEKSILKLLTQKRKKNSIFVSEAVATGWKEEEIKNTKTKKKQSSLFARYVSDSLSLSAVLSRFINYLFFYFFLKKGIYDVTKIEWRAEKEQKTQFCSDPSKSRFFWLCNGLDRWRARRPKMARPFNCFQTASP